MAFGRTEAKVSSAKFPFCKLFSIYRKHHRFDKKQTKCHFSVPKLAPALLHHGPWATSTSKRKSKSFYFKIHHLQLSSKFVSPICRLHFSSHLGNWLKIIFSTRPLLPPFRAFPSLNNRATTSASLASFPAQNLSTSTNDYRQPRVNKFKKFSRFSFAEKEAASCFVRLQCFSLPFASRWSIFRKVSPPKMRVPGLVTVQNKNGLIKWRQALGCPFHSKYLDAISLLFFFRGPLAS